MRHALAIARKELQTYFATPWAYVFLTMVVALAAFFFVGLLDLFLAAQEKARASGWSQLAPDQQGFRNLTDGVLVNLWASLSVLLVFVSPLLTMRTFAEEKRQKTFQLLMTLPVRPWSVVLGKFLGAVGVIWAALAITFCFPLALAAIAPGQLEWPTVLLGFGALLMFGTSCVAIGLFFSALTESQVISALATLVVILIWFLLDGFALRTAEPLRSIVGHLSFQAELKDLLRGVLALRPIVFFGSVNLFLLLLTHRAVQAQRWSGR